ncbi:uncharacterized protein LOC110437243 [Sorghum bicolor]|uniref:uncharacterized protein LOC110437243 n=1 Tax=Sorghum bicolor TaxID=4558 RepID=UPI000B4263DC|nr:uncharacterized protein LOC110437243 [Sorghum bicolor]|eukprot:XP_021321297.1 uncharacterized protein LOC110437243 [Sorghum bicolor]
MPQTLIFNSPPPLASLPSPHRHRRAWCGIASLARGAQGGPFLDLRLPRPSARSPAPSLTRGGGGGGVTSLLHDPRQRAAPVHFDRGGSLVPSPIRGVLLPTLGSHGATALPLPQLTAHDAPEVLNRRWEGQTRSGLDVRFPRCIVRIVFDGLAQVARPRQAGMQQQEDSGLWRGANKVTQRWLLSRLRRWRLRTFRKSEDNQPTGEQDYCHGVDELLDEDTSSTAARSDTSIFGILDFAIDFYFYA